MKRLELFQDRLYQKAKEEPERRFHSLHDKICRPDILKEAWKRVSSNSGSAGIDGQTIGDIREYGIDRFLSELRHELINETYEVHNIRRVFIPKANGKQRPLGIPTVRDRIVQQAVRLIIEPIFEADFQEFSYGYRHGKSARDASEEIVKYLNFGLTNVIDIDIHGFFDHIDHEMMIFFVSKRIADPYILKLIREWLRAGIVYNNDVSYPDEGTPQGGVISPLLANVYLNELDTLWVKKRMDDRKGKNAHLIRYADDILVLTGREPLGIANTLECTVSALGLELNREKSRITTAQEGFDFLGFHFIRRWNRFRKREVTHTEPAEKSVERFREEVRQILPRRMVHHRPLNETVERLNSLIGGWYNYYKHTNASRTFHTLQMFIQWKAAKYYCWIHKLPRVSSSRDVYPRIGNIGIARFGKIQHSSRVA